MPEGDNPVDPTAPAPGTTACPPGQRWYGPIGQCRPICPGGQSWSEDQQTCLSRSGSVSGNPTAGCPPGEEREASSAICRCPAGECRDINSKACRSPRRNEQVNETDDIERATGGGRGYCRPVDPGSVGGGGGGAGGGGGGGGVGGSKFGITGGSGLMDMFSGQSKTIWDNLTPIISGQQTRYSPEVLASMDANAKVAALGQAKAGRDAVLKDSITRGLGRSGIPSRGIETAQRDATMAYTAASNLNRVEKAKADFADRMAAIDAAEKWLGQMQAYVTTLDQTAAGREKAIAEIALGYSRIQADRDMLALRLQTDLQIAQGNNANQLEISKLLNLSHLFQ